MVRLWCALLDICDGKIRANISKISLHRRLLKGLSETPKTLGEHLRNKRVDMGLTNVQVAQIVGVAYQTIERWEHDGTRINRENRAKIVVFLGYKPRSHIQIPAADFRAGICNYLFSESSDFAAKPRAPPQACHKQSKSRMMVETEMDGVTPYKPDS